MKNKNQYSRRQFLGTASCAAIGSTTFFSTLFNLQSMSAASLSNSSMAMNNDYRALVCIMLGGGNDSFNMVAPLSSPHYEEYSVTRSNLALPKNSLLKLNPKTYNQHELGFHPSLTELKDLFDQEKLAVICNVGTLVQPTTKSDYLNNNKLPFGLYSHADQDQQWQTSVPQTKSATGWGGRLGDLVNSANNNSKVSMNISLSGKNLFQLGKDVTEYTILPSGTGSRGITGFDQNNTFDQMRTAGVKSLMEKQYQDIFKKTYANVVHASQNTHELFSSAITSSNISTAFSSNELSDRLKMVARTIKVRESLGLKRQTFFVRYDGWDHHDELTNNHANMMGVVSKAMSEFQTALGEINMEDHVTTFLISDFGRTLTSNGQGTDHAWGGNMLVMGNQVKGKEIYGLYPTLRLNSDIDVGNGVLIPKISTDEYFAELALWFGVSPGELNSIFPNISNFYDVWSGQSPLGFMNI